MTLRPRAFHLTVLALVFALGACGSKDDGKAAKAAGGDVLPGTVSDAMIDLDRTQAQAPLQAVQPSAKTAAKDTAAPAADASGAAADDQSPAPAPSPTPAAGASPKPAASASPKP